MPVGLDPDQTVTVTLRSDGGKPEDKRAVFHCRFLSARRRRELQAHIDDAGTVKTADEQDAILMKAITLGVRGWERMTDEEGQPVPFSLESLADLLTLHDKLDLARQCLTETRLKEQDFFASGWPWESRLADSVPTADPPPAGA